MSRAYVIRVAESLVHHRRVEDGVEARLEVLPILGRERTSALLVEELKRRGWLVEGQRATTVIGNATVTIDAGKGTIEVRGEVDEEVELTVEREGRAYEENDAIARAHLSRDAMADLAARAAEGDQNAQDSLADELERVLAEIKPEVDAIIDVVNRGALKERARQLGEVVEIHEDASSGEMTIRVKV